ncbi:MAG: two-component sensor histidine kinase [Flaviaesturariibacter sp.]|nr:two-component sensor histidine kinase [Flaviaesturariibacter sp.]
MPEKKLSDAIRELAFEIEEREKRAAELVVSNKEHSLQYEESLKETLDYKYALDQSSIVAITDQKGIIKYVNSNFCKISKYSSNELIGQDHRIINADYHPKEFIQDLWVTIANGKIWKGELKNKAKDGSIYWVDTTIVPFLNENNKPYQYIAIRADITERKKAEAQIIANKEEKEKRAEELIIANKELLFQNEEKEKRAAELIIANKELLFQNEEKEKRAAELIIANKELRFQNEEKEKRAAELGIANIELAFQDEEKEKRAAELVIANKELIFQNEEKEKRAEELVIANKELRFQNSEKEKRAAELIIANQELLFQSEEKEKRAEELIIANKELLFQNEEKEKRAAELAFANKELESFNYISSHDLQEPLRKIQTFSTRIITDELENLSDKGKEYFLRINDAASRMQTLIADLLAYSRISTAKRKFENTDLDAIAQEVKKDFKEVIAEKNATIDIGKMGAANIIPFQFRQLMHNLIGNALKFSRAGVSPQITIRRKNVKGSEVKDQKLLPEEDYCHITVADNGIGFAPEYKEHIFEIFKRLHDAEKITGTGIGLTIVKKIIANHNGIITATGELNKGATFDIYIPFLPPPVS